MATRKRDLRPDAKGRYRPYVGWYEGRFGNEETKAATGSTSAPT